MLSAAACLAQQPSIEVVRASLKKAAQNEQECKLLLTSLHTYTHTNDVLYAGYKACATMIMAKYAINPYNKFSYFLEGKKLLENCIKNETKNIELRVLRLSVQLKAPAFLGYNNNIKTDKEFILNALPKITDNKTKHLLKTMLLNSNCLTNLEKQSL
jgi:hypothetical protein